MGKILYFDIETSTLDVLHRTYGLKIHTKYHNYKDIIRDWNIFSAAWKWEGEDKVHCVSVTGKDPTNDYGVVKILRDVLDGADVIIGHNSDRFDLRKFNARAIKHGFMPIGKKTTIDTLKVARKTFDFSSNTLGYLASYLGVGHKENRPDWDAILAGDGEAIAYMRLYNKQDVVVTEQVYKKLRGWHNTHPDMNKTNPIRDTAGHAVLLCPTCQSPNTIKDGFKINLQIKKQRHQCKDCGQRFLGDLVK